MSHCVITTTTFFWAQSSSTMSVNLSLSEWLASYAIISRFISSFSLLIRSSSYSCIRIKSFCSDSLVCCKELPPGVCCWPPPLRLRVLPELRVQECAHNRVVDVGINQFTFLYTRACASLAADGQQLGLQSQLKRQSAPGSFRRSKAFYSAEFITTRVEFEIKSARKLLDTKVGGPLMLRGDNPGS